MTFLQNRQEIPLSEVPKAIYLPSIDRAQLPSCYRGTPLEMVRAMAAEIGPDVSPQDAIDWNIHSLQERGLKITIPKMDEATRATLFIAALLHLGLVKDMPKS
jgi:hypothetical protein